MFIQDILGILQTLKEQTSVTEAVLRVRSGNCFCTPQHVLTVAQESKAGLAVGKLRTHASRTVSDLAKEIVKKWKQAVEQEKLQSGGKSPATNAASRQPRAYPFRAHVIRHFDPVSQYGNSPLRQQPLLHPPLHQALVVLPPQSQTFERRRATA